MSDFFNAILLVYAGLFAIVNPIGSAPIFLGLTRHVSADERHTLAGRVAVNGFLLLLGSLFVGSHVLEFFGITLPIVRVAGGLVVTAFGWKLLHVGEDVDALPVPGKPVPATDAFYPLTMPLTIGPGSISVAITLGSQRPQATTGLAQLALLAAGAVAGLVAIAVTVFLCYRFAERLVAVLGERGANVLMRLSAFILLCIGIQIIWSGYSKLIAGG